MKWYDMRAVVGQIMHQEESPRTFEEDFWPMLVLSLEPDKKDRNCVNVRCVTALGTTIMFSMIPHDIQSLLTSRSYQEPDILGSDGTVVCTGKIWRLLDT